MTRHNKDIFSQFRFIYTVLLLSVLYSTATAQDTVTISFIGDVMQHQRQLYTALKPGADSLDPESYDYSSYFSRIGDAISGADFAVANMEFSCGLTPFTGYPRFSAPESLAEEAQKAGVDLFLCANNHIFDRGTAGVESTISVYRRLGEAYTGVYSDSTDLMDRYPYITDIKGIKIAFINFTYGLNGNKADYPVSMMDSAEVKKAIGRAISNECDLIVALPHWGEEYILEPSAEQIKWKEMLYREGVRVIIGGHPHVIQSVDVSYSDDGAIDSLTAYSLGNYISNMSLKNTQVGMLFKLKLVKDTLTGKTGIASADAEWLWCARGGKYERNYTVFPIEEYLGKKNEFIVKEEFHKMKKTYLHLREIIKYGK